MRFEREIIGKVGEGNIRCGMRGMGRVAEGEGLTAAEVQKLVLGSAVRWYGALPLTRTLTAF